MKCQVYGDQKEWRQGSARWSLPVS